MKRLWHDIKKHRRLLLACAGLLLITRWVYLRTLPERLLEVTAPIQAIHNGKIYLLRQDWEKADFQMCPADQPVERRIAREVLDNSQVAGMTVAETGIYYVLQPRGFTQVARTLPGQRPRPEGRATPQFRLRKLSLDGGNPTDIPAHVGQPNPIIGGQSVYWLEPDTFSAEGRVATNRLMTAPTSGGDGKVLLKALPRRLQLSASDDGVYWTAPAAGHPDQKSLFHMSQADSQPGVITPYAGTRAPVEMEGRLYWIEQTPDPENATLELVSARPDGTDRESVFKRATYRLKYGAGLGERISRVIPHRGKLYFLSIRAEDRTSSDTTQPAELFCVDAGPGKTAHEVHKFDNLYDRYVFIDGDYYYYTVIELQEASVFSFSTEGLFLKRQPVLYRYRLPG